MIDTIHTGYSCYHVGRDLDEAIMALDPEAVFTQSAYGDRSRPWTGARFKLGEHVTAGYKESRTGAEVWTECSLGNLLYGDNCRLLNYGEVREGLREAQLMVERAFSDFKIGKTAIAESAHVRRADFYYQREVGDVPSAAMALASAFPRQDRIARYETGFVLSQSRHQRARFYGKGIESGNEAYYGVLRHEEQVRSENKAGFYVDPATCTVRVREVRAMMNKRFDGLPEEMDHFDLRECSDDAGKFLPGAVALVMYPELDMLYKTQLSKDTYYKYRRAAAKCRARKLRFDPRVPVDAWEG